MLINAYLTRSRHSIFYFRWPLRPAADNEGRRCIRLSLQTRCPREATTLARELAAFGTSLERTGELNTMRHDELRKVVHAAFKARLVKMLDGIGADGPMSELARAPLQTSQMLTEGTPEDFRAIALAGDPTPFLSRFCASSGLPQSEAEERPERLLREIQMAWRDMLREFEKHHAALTLSAKPDRLMPALCRVDGRSLLPQRLPYVTPRPPPLSLGQLASGPCIFRRPWPLQCPRAAAPA